MKRINIFFLLYNCALVSLVSAMDVQNKLVRKGTPKKSVVTKISIELEESQIGYQTGDKINYYKEYHPNKRSQNIVVFPLLHVDPLPIESCGDTRFFCTSAHPDSFGSFGQPYMILNPAIKQMAVVRGVRQSSEATTYVYMGFDTDEFKLVGNRGFHKIYTAKIMALSTKDNCGTRPWFQPYKLNSKDVQTFGIEEIRSEVQKFLVDSGVKEVIGWKTPLFKLVAANLLKNRFEDFDVEHGFLSESDCYWTNEENKLKHILYNAAENQ